MERLRPFCGPNLENLKIWVDGLLSGDFEQGKGRLAYCTVDPQGVRSAARYCCLGVGTELAIRHGVDINVTTVEQGDLVIYEYNGSRDFLPHVVREWLGVDNENPTLDAKLPHGTAHPIGASALNDGVDVLSTDDRQTTMTFNFRQIALAIIRTYNLPGYEHLLEEADAPTD